MLDNLSKYRVVLGSNSPRRKELLTALGIPFEVRTMEGIDETYPSSLAPKAIARFLAKKKAATYRPTLADDELLITADTLVSCSGEILGKPTSEEEARQMLRKLSLRTHKVITGVSLTASSFQKTFTVTSSVTFLALEEDEIAYYVRKYQPLDKAGSYGIQEWIGFVAVRKIAGNFQNVMGLPVHRLYHELKKL